MAELKGVKSYEGEFDEEEDEQGLPGEEEPGLSVKLPGRKRKRRGLKDVGPSFWTAQRVFILFVFLLGLVLGGFLAHQYVEPELNKRIVNDLNAFNATNKALDRKVDFLVECLHSQQVNPDTCLKEQ